MPTAAATHASDSQTAASIVQQLEEEIALGVLRPRERLVEEDLLARFASKRHIIRQALVTLEAMGIVRRPPNRGAMVRDLTLKEIEEIYFMRELLERAAIRIMPLPVDGSTLAALTDLHRQHGQAAAEGRLRSVFRLNLEFHRTLFDACGNALLSAAIEQFAFKSHAVRSYTIGEPRLLARVREEHAQMIGLLAGDEGNREALAAIVLEHKLPAKQAYMQTLRHIEPLAAGSTPGPGAAATPTAGPTTAPVATPTAKGRAGGAAAAGAMRPHAASAAGNTRPAKARSGARHSG